MEKELTKISIKGKEYPIKCSNYVLAMIQDKYENLTDFETLLSGKKPVLLKNGEHKKDKEGNDVYKVGEPSIEAINFMLPLVVNEGIEIEAELLNTKAEVLDNKYIIRNVDVNVFELSVLLRLEFYKAVTAKK